MSEIELMKALELAIKEYQIENKREARISSYQLRVAEQERRVLDLEWNRKIKEDE